MSDNKGNSLWPPVITMAVLYGFVYLVHTLEQYKKGLGGDLFVSVFIFLVTYPILRYVFKKGISEAKDRIIDVIYIMVFLISIIFVLGTLSKCSSGSSNCYYRVGCV